MWGERVAVSQITYDWVMEYARRYGIDYTAAVNQLLVTAKEKIERQDRIEAKRESAYTQADYELLAAEKGENPRA